MIQEWPCSPETFWKKQEDSTKQDDFSFGPFAYLKFEPAYRVRLPDWWIKSKLFDNIPKVWTKGSDTAAIETKEFINKDSIAQTTAAFPLKLRKKGSFFGGLFGAGNKDRGEPDPLEDVSSSITPVIMLTGTQTESGIFRLTAHDLQSSLFYHQSSTSTEPEITPFFPPFTRLDLSFMLYSWRLCRTKGSEIGLDEKYIFPFAFETFDLLEIELTSLVLILKVELKYAPDHINIILLFINVIYYQVACLAAYFHVLNIVWIKWKI